MSRFVKISTSEILANADKSVKVKLVKFRKKGTQRIFFTPEVDGKRLTSTMFARLTGARNIGRQYLANLKTNI